jgi:hypothetical protein
MSSHPLAADNQPMECKEHGSQIYKALGLEPLEFRGCRRAAMVPGPAT